MSLGNSDMEVNSSVSELENTHGVVSAGLESSISNTTEAMNEAIHTDNDTNDFSLACPQSHKTASSIPSPNNPSLELNTGSAIELQRLKSNSVTPNLLAGHSNRKVWEQSTLDKISHRIIHEFTDIEKKAERALKRLVNDISHDIETEQESSRPKFKNLDFYTGLVIPVGFDDDTYDAIYKIVFEEFNSFLLEKFPQYQTTYVSDQNSQKNQLVSTPTENLNEGSGFAANDDNVSSEDENGRDPNSTNTRHEFKYKF